MGSWPEWERVIRDAVYYGLFMFLTFWILNRRSDKDGGRQNLLTFIATLYVGISYGLNTTFHSRMWHWPLSMVSAVILVSYLGVALTFRREVASNWRRDWELWGPPAQAYAALESTSVMRTPPVRIPGRGWRFWTGFHLYGKRAYQDCAGPSTA